MRPARCPRLARPARRPRRTHAASAHPDGSACPPGVRLCTAPASWTGSTSAGWPQGQACYGSWCCRLRQTLLRCELSAVRCARSALSPAAADGSIKQAHVVDAPLHGRGLRALARPTRRRGRSESGSVLGCVPHDKYRPARQQGDAPWGYIRQLFGGRWRARGACSAVALTAPWRSTIAFRRGTHARHHMRRTPAGCTVPGCTSSRLLRLVPPLDGPQLCSISVAGAGAPSRASPTPPFRRMTAAAAAHPCAVVPSAAPRRRRLARSQRVYPRASRWANSAPNLS
jgi:hypothetical protein